MYEPHGGRDSSEIENTQIIFDPRPREQLSLMSDQPCPEVVIPHDDCIKIQEEEKTSDTTSDHPPEVIFDNENSSQGEEIKTAEYDANMVTELIMD